MSTTVRVSSVARKAYRTILDALMSLNSVRGDAVVLIDPGEYNESFIVATNVELRAASGPGTVTITGSGSATITSSGSLRLVDLKLVSRGDTTVKVTAGNVTLQGCEIWGYGNGGVLAEAGSTVMMNDCDVHVGRLALIGAKGTLTGVRSHNITDNAIAVFEGAAARIEDCVVANAGIHGIRVQSSTATIARCDISGTGDVAISVDTHGEAAISNCRIHQVHSIGVQFNSGGGELRDTQVLGAETGISLINGARPVIDRCRLDDCRDAGVTVNERSAGEFTDIEINRPGNVGFYVSKSSTPEVRGCKISGGITSVMVIGTGSGGTYSDLHLAGSVAGIRVKKPATAKFSGVEIADCDCGIEVAGYGTTMSLTDSRIQDVKTHGLFVEENARVTLDRCVVRRPGSTGFRIETAGRITVKDSEVLETGLGGVQVLGNSSFVAERFTVIASRGYGLRVQNTSWVDVVASEFKDNKGDGILLEDRCHGRITGCTTTGNGGRDLVPNDGVMLDPAEDVPAAESATRYTESAAQAELEDLIGLSAVKKQVRTQVNLIKVAEQRVKAGLPAPPTSRHLVFSGPPGTGKTTVARLYGQILASLGVLDKGQVIEVSRSDLVGQYLGATAMKTKAVFEKAVGGVLFIDEAFALSRVFGVNSDLGLEAIDELVKLMEDRRDDVVVIAAGYTDEMKTFLDTNPGLKSRFSRVIDFPAYEPDELVQIFAQQAVKNHYQVHDDLLEQVTVHFQRHPGSNARDARTLLETMLERHADRLSTVESPTREQLLWLLLVDFPED